MRTFSSMKTVFHVDSLPRGELYSSVSMSGWGGMTCLAKIRVLGNFKGGQMPPPPLPPNETPEDMSSCTLTINSIPSPQGWYPSNLKQILNGYCQALGARRLCLNSGRSSVRSPLHLHPAQPDKSPPPRNKMNSEL